MTDYVQSTDNYATGADGFDFPADNDTLTINVGVLLGSVDQYGVVSDHNGNILTNNGNILSGGSASTGVYFLGNGGSINNNAGHSIIGPWGIDIEGDGDEVLNSGLVMGFQHCGVLIGPNSS